MAEKVKLMSRVGSICRQCGGLKTEVIEKITLTAEARKDRSFNVFCRCINPEPEHDGKLPFDQYGGSGVVSYHQWSPEITTVMLDLDGYDNMHLGAKKALSLRDWLNQESSTLEKMAKEQET